jgi:hypothetical protein
MISLLFLLLLLRNDLFCWRWMIFLLIFVKIYCYVLEFQVTFINFRIIPVYGLQILTQVK